MAGVAGFFIQRRYEFGALELQSDGTLWVEGERMHLPPKELKLLEALLSAGGAVVMKDALLNHAWPGMEVGEDSLTRCIYSLRRAFGRYKKYIATVYGKGYRLTCEVKHHEVQPSVLSSRLLPRSFCLKPADYTPAGLAQAAEQQRRLVAENGQNAQAWCGLAEALLAQASLALCEHETLVVQIDEALGKALEAQPDYGDALVRLAFVAGAQGSVAAAHSLERAAAGLPCTSQADALFYRAWLQWCNRQYGAAAVLLDEALRLAPQSVAAWLLRCRVAFAYTPEVALDTAQRARKAVGEVQPVMACWYAMVLAWQGRPRAAWQCLRNLGCDAPLAGELGLWQAYVLACHDRAAARQRLASWQEAQAGWPVSAEELAVRRELNGDGAIIAEWRAFTRRAQPWQRARLDDPRLRNLGVLAAKASA
ncbi:winged helix-turn-helix domain-containing protein [Pseudomonas typographi]|uniref:OmpR/PhoB-type domain-containing protein n=1 Tax=Pseudomonas typographi TaxID=2715964 RepID=A0ABR7Z206_9PSED|nr:winged helix-turn-helix domain-containing protein [Pseudomonas typographi]MBD1552398.1 hypothetical protein [Pseudomonas typographi]MBD1587207.1 hypothetical protein [Pseudomonas typographi]MBD1599520.1 hypothetical protein [Pseudomonas typographi]